MWVKKSFTLIEFIVVIVIVGILAALALPNYNAIKEKALNREANVSLALIRAAEKIYRMEHAVYYGPESDVVRINEFLKLSLPENVSRLWTFALAPPSADATRTGVGADARVWSIFFPGDTDPACAGGTYCP